MLFEDSPGPRMPPPDFLPPEGAFYEYDDGNGLWITSGVSRRHRRVFAAWCISQDYRTEDAPELDTPIFFGLIFRDLQP